MFRVLSDIHLGSDSVRIVPITRNIIKQDPFSIYVGFGSVRIHFYRIGFDSGFRVQFICPARVKCFELEILVILQSEAFICFINLPEPLRTVSRIGKKRNSTEQFWSCQIQLQTSFNNSKYYSE